MARQLAITKTVDLSSIAPGWDGCFVTVTPAAYGEFIELTKLQVGSASQTDILVKGLEISRSHFVTGQVMALDSDNKPEKVEMEVDDLDANRDIADLVLQEVLGVAPDPKGSSTETETSSISEQQTSMSDTKTE